MKKFFYVTIGLLMSLSFEGVSQCSSWGTGEDSVQALQAYSLYREYYKAKDYTEALKHWRYVYKNAPAARKSPFIDGAKMIEAQIKANKENKELKSSYVDTLLSLYDRRIECHGEEGKVLGMKAAKMLKYRSKTHLMQVIGDFKKSVEIEGPKSKSQVLGNYFKAITIAVKKDSVSKEEAFDVYLTIMPLVEENLANASDKIKASYEKTRGKIEEGLKKIIADCSEAKLAFEDSYKKRPDDPKLWKAIFSIYRNLGEECTKDPIFNEVAVKLFDQDSVAIYAIVVALNASDASTAKKYFDLAIESEEDVEKKASYAMKYAKFAKDKLGSLSVARSYALKAASIRTDWGEPYLFVGDLYAGSGKACGPGTGFQSQVVVWPALDMWNKAKSVDPECSGRANKKIQSYNGFMPSKQDCFMNGITQEGQSFKVDCWINTTTTVRFAN